MRGSFPSRLTPSFSQLMEGMGSPDAWHFNIATLSTPSVWLDGPWRMMGGGLSVSTAIERQKRERITSLWSSDGWWCSHVSDGIKKLSYSIDHKMHWGWMWVSIIKSTIFSAGLVIAPQNNDHILYFQEAGNETAECCFLVSLMWQRDAKQFPVTARVALFLYTTVDSVVQLSGKTLAYWLSVVQINTSLCAVWGTIKGEFQILNVTETTSWYPQTGWQIVFKSCHELIREDKPSIFYSSFTLDER